MVRVSFHLYAVLDPKSLDLLPESSRIQLWIDTPETSYVTILDHHGRSYPLLSEDQAAGAASQGGFEGALTPKQAEKYVKWWFKRHIKKLHLPDPDMTKFYFRPPGG